MNWKEEFDLRIELGSFWVTPSSGQIIKDFISTQFEKLIAEIPDKTFLDAGRGTDVMVKTEFLKQQLRDKWL